MTMLYGYTDNEINFHHSRDEIPDFQGFQMHLHEHFEIYFFLLGEADYVVEGTQYSMKSGSMIITRPTEAHMVRLNKALPYERFALHFSPTLLNGIDDNHSLLNCFLNRNLGKKNLFLPIEFCEINPRPLLNAMCNDNLVDKRTAIISHLFPLLFAINEAFQKKGHEKPPSPKGLTEELVSFVNLHLLNELSLADLEKRFYLSRSQLNRSFNSATGSSIFAYVSQKRLLQARQMLKSGETANNACQQCGFKDYSSFYRAYIKQFGISPKEDMTGIARLRQTSTQL